MKFVEFECGNTGEVISVDPNWIDSVYEANNVDNDEAIIRIGDKMVRVVGTRAEVVHRLEAFELWNEKKQREADQYEGRAQAIEQSTTPGTLPTEPGFYEYRWPGPGSRHLDQAPWHPVEVARREDPGKSPESVLVVRDLNVEGIPLLGTYENAEWRKREPK